jgi:REP-associated tyrosine transposase
MEMGRVNRLIDSDFVYHVVNRGNNRQDVFHDESDYRAYLESLERTQLRYPFRLFGYCLLTNHVHLLLRTEPGVSVSRIMQSLTVAHTWRYHRRHSGVGHVWQGRFKSPVVQDDSHFWTVLRYIEANPLRAGLTGDPADYPWSSYLAHGLGHEDPLLTPIPDWSDLGRTEPIRRAVWRRKVRAALPEQELSAIRQSLASGRPFGTLDWSASLADALGISREPKPPGRPRKHAVTAK